MSTEYKPGDRVIIYRNGKPTHASTVKSVRSYKQRTKVTLDDDTEWASTGGRWERDAFTTMHLNHATEAALEALAMVQRHRAVEWVSANWPTLTDEQRTAIGDLARTARKAAKP